MFVFIWVATYHWKGFEEGYNFIIGHFNHNS